MRVIINTYGASYPGGVSLQDGVTVDYEGTATQIVTALAGTYRRHGMAAKVLRRSVTPAERRELIAAAAATGWVYPDPVT